MRCATAADAAALSELARRSKGYWPYDAAFLERMRSALAVSAEYVTECPVHVLEIDGRAAAFYGFRVIEGEPFLHDLWVDPDAIGIGLGRALWNHAIATARTHHYAYFLIESDPNAEGFYARMGARRVGERLSPESGRCLPLLRCDLPSA